MIITYSRLVERDIDEICDYYESEREGLSDTFFAEFESTIASIKKNPSFWPPIAENSNKRKATLKVFPYVIVYRIVTQKRIRVFVVKHQKRSERFGMSRR